MAFEKVEEGTTRPILILQRVIGTRECLLERALVALPAHAACGERRVEKVVGDRGSKYRKPCTVQLLAHAGEDFEGTGPPAGSHDRELSNRLTSVQVKPTVRQSDV